MPDEPEARQRLIDNERTKLTATYFNNLAGACSLAGVIAPVASMFYGVQVQTSRFWGSYVIVWVLLAAALHIVARNLLKGLHQP